MLLTAALKHCFSQLAISQEVLCRLYDEFRPKANVPRPRHFIGACLSQIEDSALDARLYCFGKDDAHTDLHGLATWHASDSDVMTDSLLDIGRISIKDGNDRILKCNSLELRWCAMPESD
jgi:hypothetical protein